MFAYAIGKSIVNDLVISETEYLQIKKTIKALFDTIFISPNDIESILNLLIHDKKNEYGKVQFALLNGIGKISINQLVENDVIRASFDDYKL